METTQAISVLETASQNAGAILTQQSQLKDALDIAIAQLQGTLTTQLDELKTANDTIASLQAGQAAVKTPTADAAPNGSTPVS